jgi:glutamyl/glutaminyl-tRNA synthetase
MPEEEYLNFVEKFLDTDISFTDHRNLLLLLFKSNLAYASQINNLIDATFKSSELFTDKFASLIKTESFIKNIVCFKELLKNIEVLDLNNSVEIVKKVKELTGLNGMDLYMPIRLVTIGKEHGPEMNKILTIVGKEKILENIANIGL